MEKFRGPRRLHGGRFFFEFVAPLRPEDIRGKTILEVGCGGGRWLEVCARLEAKEIVGVDFSEAVEVAARRTRNFPQVEVLQASIFSLPLKPAFDIVMAIGVVHHLRDPREGVHALVQAAKKIGDLVVLSTYSREGNEICLKLIGPLRKITAKLPRRLLHFHSMPLAAVVYGHCKLLRPLLRALRLREPMADYFDLLSRLTFRDIWSVVYDQLVPQLAAYPTRSEVLGWIDGCGAEFVELWMRTGNSWRIHLCKPQDCSGRPCAE